MSIGAFTVRGVGIVLFVELFGAIGTLELMAFAGNTEHRKSQNQ